MDKNKRTINEALAEGNSNKKSRAGSSAAAAHAASPHSQVQFRNWDSLQTHGLCVVPFKADESKGMSLEEQFDESIARQPEFQKDGKCFDGQLVGGGFAALANAHSFHDAFPREMRKHIHRALKAHFDSVYPGRKKEVICDRMCRREPGQKPMSEGWHRDLTPTSGNEHVRCTAADKVFGGWINMNATQIQRFVCVPGTQIDNPALHTSSGFTKLTEAEKTYAAQHCQTVEIPPGNMLLFEQSLIHCVNSVSLPYTMKRLYVAFRVSPPETTEPLVVDLRRRLLAGEVMPLKSGQMPAMYPKLWVLNWPDKLIETSKKFPEFMKELRVVRGKRLAKVGLAQKEYRVLKLVAPPVPPVIPYDEEEMALYEPHV